MDFLKKLNNLHPAVQFYFENEISADFIKIVTEKYKSVPAEKVERLVREFVVNDFDLKIQNDIKDDFQGEEGKIISFIVDFLGVIFYPIAEFLPKNGILRQIQENGGDSVDYEEYKNKLELKILEEENKLLEDVVDYREKTTNIEEENIAMNDLFAYSLADILKDTDFNSINLLNSAIILLLNNKIDFQSEIVKTLFNNQEKLTNKDFVLDKKKQIPTISNWLKDFIKKNGSGMIDGLALSQYLAGSENAKKLDSQEKKILHKLLILYRNLKFFPESMGNAPAEEWEIFPLDDEDRSFKKPQRIEKKDERIVELENLLEQYEEGSLERRAIEEEMKKLNHEL